MAEVSTRGNGAVGRQLLPRRAALGSESKTDGAPPPPPSPLPERPARPPSRWHGHSHRGDPADDGAGLPELFGHGIIHFHHFAVQLHFPCGDSGALSIPPGWGKAASPHQIPSHPIPLHRIPPHPTPPGPTGLSPRPSTPPRPPGPPCSAPPGSWGWAPRNRVPGGRRGAAGRRGGGHRAPGAPNKIGEKNQRKIEARSGRAGAGGGREGGKGGRERGTWGCPGKGRREG